MISREEAERIMGEPVVQPPIINIDSTSLYDWLEDISLLNFPDLASKVLTKRAEFVVHPGFSYDYKIDPDVPDRFINYTEKLKAKVKSVLGEKTLLVWTDYGYKRHTVTFLDVDRDSLVLVPTCNGTNDLKENILRIKEKQFYRKLSKYVKSAGLMGEYTSGCVSGVERCCRKKINTHRVEGLTYPPK